MNKKFKIYADSIVGRFWRQRTGWSSLESKEIGDIFDKVEVDLWMVENNAYDGVGFVEIMNV